MSKTLGLDLGTNSIGWAFIHQNETPSGEHSGKIEGMGSRIFSAGVENLGEGEREQSKNATRRDKRQNRRQNFRRKLRKERLAKLLIRHGMFPDLNPVYRNLTGEDPTSVKFRKKFQTVIRQVQLPEKIRDFFSIDPYKARFKAYKGKKLTLHEMGRIWYHFAQRRGYKESLQDSEKDEGALFEGKPKEGKTGINETKQKIEEYGTLGNYLYHEDPHEKRLRNRYTLRSMYEKEFQIIWNSQKDYYPDVLTEELKQQIGGSKRQGDKQDGLLFYQRPLRSQKHLIGNCTFETDKPRCSKSTIPFELSRAYEWINNIRNGTQPLSDEDRAVAMELFKSKSKAFPFKMLRKKLSDPDGNYNYKDKDKLPSCPTIANFRNIFGKQQWEDLSLKEQEKIWHIKHFAKDPDWLEQYARQKWDLDEKKISKLKSFYLNKDYARKSRKAIMNMLPHLKAGYIYDEAVLLGGLRSAFGATEWDQMPPEKHRKIEEEIMEIAKNGEAEGKAIDRIKIFLKEKYLLSNQQVDNLYHHSAEKEVEQQDHLPEPKNVRNPVVQQALYEMRNLVNSIVDIYGKPDEIRVELARELKASKSHRNEIRQMQQEREEENNKIKAELDKYELPHTRNNIEKFKLYNELKDHSGKAVNPFNPEQTFSIDNLINGYVQVEHIIPYSISLNNSFANKTLCDADTNRDKGDRTPYQYFQDQPQRWQLIHDHIFDILPHWKARRFISKTNPDSDDFIERQLNDTRYISKQAKNYLKHICSKVNIAQGTVTSMLRHFWGLDGILEDTYKADADNGEYLAAVDDENGILELVPWNFETLKKDESRLAKKGKMVQGYVKDGTLYPFKQRTDHRHHAIDALAVACSEKKFLQQISRLSGRGYNHREIKKEEQFEVPWEGFWQDANKAVHQILVSHKQTDRILTKVKKQLYDYTGKPKTDKHGSKLPPAEGMAARGQLHKETVYGKHNGKDGEEYYHVRKSLEEIKSDTHVAKIVDPKIRELVLEAIKKADPDINLDKKFKVPNHAFFEYDEQTKQKKPRVFLPNKNGDPVPVKKVRIQENIGNAVQLKEDVNQYVNPRNNHHIVIYKKKNGDLDKSVITFWEAVESKRQNISVYRLPHNGQDILNTFQENDMYLLGLANEEIQGHLSGKDYIKLSEYLYKVQKISGGDYFMELCFRNHTDSRKDAEAKSSYIYIKGFGEGKTGWFNYNPVKVTVSPIGKINLVD